MAIIARVTGRDRQFIPSSELAADKPTSFIIRNDDFDVQRRMEGLFREYGGGAVEEGEGNSSLTWEQVRVFLKGWKNLMDPDDPEKEAEFVTDEEGLPTDETIAKIPLLIRTEIANYAIEARTLTETDKKN